MKSQMVSATELHGCDEAQRHSVRAGGNRWLSPFCMFWFPPSWNRCLFFLTSCPLPGYLAFRHPDTRQTRVSGIHGEGMRVTGVPFLSWKGNKLLQPNLLVCRDQYWTLISCTKTIDWTKDIFSDSTGWHVQNWDGVACFEGACSGNCFSSCSSKIFKV